MQCEAPRGTHKTKRQVSARLSPDNLDFLAEVARTEGRSLANALDRAVEAWRMQRCGEASRAERQEA